MEKYGKRQLIKGVFVIFVSHVSLFCSLWQYVTMLFAELPSKSSNRSPKTTRSALHLQHTLLSEPSLEGACRGLATTAFQAFHGYSMAIPWLFHGSYLHSNWILILSQSDPNNSKRQLSQPTFVYIMSHCMPSQGICKHSKPVVTVVAQAYLSDLVWLVTIRFLQVIK